MRRVLPPIWAFVLGCVVLALAWLVPGLLDGAVLADTMLRQDYKLPELMAGYVPELRHSLQLTLGAGGLAALVAFIAWLALAVAIRPTGPGQVARGWRLVYWGVLAVLAAAAAYLVIAFRVLGAVDSIDELFANRMAAAVALGAAVVFWVLCLVGTERMIRPAVPGGSVLVGRA